MIFVRHSIWKRPRFIICIILSVLCIYLLCLSDKKNKQELIFRLISRYPLLNLPTEQQQQQSCKLPNPKPNDPEILELLKQEHFEPLDCTKKYPLLFHSHVLPYPHLVPVANIQEQVGFCCYRKVLLDSPQEFSQDCWNVSLTEETVISTQHEFISIECTFPKDKNDRRIVDMHTFPHPPSNNQPSLQANQNPNKLNVVILGLDTMSRTNFERVMPETRDYILNTLNAVDMEGYNKIGDNTLPNIGPMLTNQFISDDYSSHCVVNGSSENCNFIWLQFQKQGYHTAFSEDEVTMQMSRHFHFGPRATEYFFVDFLNLMGKYLGHEQRIAANMCLGPRPAYHKSMEFVQKMASLMKQSNNPYFQISWSSAVTHDLFNGGKLIDKDLKEVLRWYKEGGYLENTALFLISDHGSRIGGIRTLAQGFLEDRLPMFLLVLPTKFKERNTKALENLMNNKKRLITPWDVHQTLRHILQPENLGNDKLSEFTSTSNQGISLFHPVPLTRTCEMAGVPLIYCTCNHIMTSVSENEPEVGQVIEAVFQEINSILKPQPLCVQLKLGRILGARRITFGGDDKQLAVKSRVWKAYHVFFYTYPQWTIFDALVVNEIEGGKWTPKNIGQSTWYWLDQKNTCLGEYSTEIRQLMIYCYCKDLML